MTSSAKPSGVPARLVILSLVAVLVLPGMVFAGLLLQRFAQSENERYRQEAREVASTAASILDRYLGGWQTTLQTLATSENLRSRNFEAFYRQATLVKHFVGAEIGLRRIDGEQIVNTRFPYGSQLPNYKFDVDSEAIATRKPVVSNIFIGAMTGEPLVTMIIPLEFDGRPEFLLHISANTQRLNDVLKPVVPANWVVAVGDRRGQYVTRSEDHEAFSGKPGVPAFLEKAVGASGNFEGQSAKGEPVLVGYVRSDLADWLVAASVHQSIIRQPLNTALQSLIAFGLAALLVASLIALWLWGLIGRPLAILTKASGQLGRLAGPIAAPTRLREFAALRNALSDASEQIRSDSAALEERVAARTRELEETNARLAAEIEQRSRIETMLVQAQKMEAIGNLTGGVAHDFNNLLQVVGGNLQLLAREVPGNDKAQARIEKAMAGVARGSHLASQLLAFGRRQPLEPKVVNIGRLIRGMDDLLRRTLGEAVEIETVIAGGLWNTLVDPANLENAILNLAINSRDAMGGHGRLTVEAGNAFLDDAYAAAHADVTAGQYVQIAVSDTGSGMSREIIEQVFEPFFSTKPEGKGTGLGLSMVYGFVKQSGGHVKVYSEPGQGTTMRLYLPRSIEAEDIPAEVDTGPVVGGNEIVLVVEDDDAVRDTVIGLLDGLGYRVLKAPDAQSALVVVESGVAIDLLFTDVVMPGSLKSAELARKAKERLPQLSVLFTSGYTENSIVHGGRLDAGVNLLSKPYTRDALARKIRQVLARDGKMPKPAAEQPEAQAAPAPERTIYTVLVCEDEALIRLDTIDLLQELGHIAVEAENGMQALELLTNGNIDILMTDVGLPDLRGDELARRARQMRPEQPVVFVTGHSEVAGFEDAPRTVVLKKPYAFEALERAIETVMAKEAAES
ncbi:response regulator [Bosea sp. WAO]|uniref:response regulator n=1 Tax=Bosea sp. WAO TaxID=406341 RepID=UPI00082CE0F9|nr:response regulator [Bosea sp. WAO]